MITTHFPAGPRFGPAAVCLLLTLTLHGCTNRMEPTQAPQAEARPLERTDSEWPAHPDRLVTTDGDAYLENLNGQIDGLRSHPGLDRLPSLQSSLARLLYHRFQLEGRVTDAEQARALAASANADPQAGAPEALLQARILNGFHDFDGVRQALESARRRGAPEAALRPFRQRLQAATELPSAEPPTAADTDDYAAHVTRGAAWLDRGHPERAEQAFRAAQDAYRDSSPYPLAWIYVQQGIGFLRYGDIGSARTFFAAAHQRVPAYYVATEHLAETEALLGRMERSAELYRRVTAQNDQPAFWHARSEVERELGNDTAADDAARRAADGYRELLATHPMMFADHAVDYLVESGQVAEALQLAQRQFEDRQDLAARLALAAAWLANDNPQAACAQVSAIRRAGLSPPEITRDDEPLSRC